MTQLYISLKHLPDARIINLDQIAYIVIDFEDDGDEPCLRFWSSNGNEATVYFGNVFDEEHWYSMSKEEQEERGTQALNDILWQIATVPKDKGCLIMGYDPDLSCKYRVYSQGQK